MSSRSIRSFTKATKLCLIADLFRASCFVFLNITFPVITWTVFTMVFQISAYTFANIYVRITSFYRYSERILEYSLEFNKCRRIFLLHRFKYIILELRSKKIIQTRRLDFRDSVLHQIYTIHIVVNTID